MKQIKYIIGSGIAVMAAVLIAMAGNPPQDSSTADNPAHSAHWLTDYAAAQKKAKAEGKPLVLDFTGSDWCPWCIKLDHEILDTSAFREYADKNLVLVKVDFPVRHPQAASLKEQNEHLQQQFQIEGYPTVLVLNANGKQLGQLGYMDGGPKPFLAKLADLTKS